MHGRSRRTPFAQPHCAILARSDLIEVNDRHPPQSSSFLMASATKTVRVWDPLVRIGHWTLVTAFATAYLTGDDVLQVHEWAGYVVAAYVLFRIVWGFAGSEHARFADFLYGPRRAIAYLIDMLRRQAKRYLGHSPAGSLMVFALLAMLSGTVVTGTAELAASYGRGPLSVLIAQRPERSDRQASHDSAAPDQEEEESESPLQEIHELFANATLILIAFHIAGVAVASLSHRENLVMSMISGRKRAAGEDD